MSLDNFSPQLQRLVGQIRFRPTLGTFGATYLMAEKLESKFKEWRGEAANITLYSPEDKKFLQITSDTLTYLNEKDSYPEELVNYIEKSFAACKEHPLSVKDVRRVGVRSTNLLKSNFEFQELVDLIYKKFYREGNQFSDLSADEVKDVMFALDGEKNGFKNHVHLGPTKKDEGLSHFKSNFDIETETINESNLFIDVDVFTSEGLNTTNSLDELRKAILESKRIVDDYLDYVDS